MAMVWGPVWITFASSFRHQMKKVWKQIHTLDSVGNVYQAISYKQDRYWKIEIDVFLLGSLVSLSHPICPLFYVRILGLIKMSILSCLEIELYLILFLSIRSKKWIFSDEIFGSVYSQVSLVSNKNSLIRIISNTSFPLKYNLHIL